MKQKILLISSNSSERGGGERYLVYLTQGLKQIDCEVHVLLSDMSYMDIWEKLFLKENAIVHRLPLLGIRHRPLRFIQSISDKNQQQKISNICQQIKADGILINQQYDEDGLDYLAGALMAKVAPVGGIIHLPMTANKNKRPLGKLRGKLLQKWYEHHPYHLIFVSEGSQKEFFDYYSLINKKTHIVHSGYTMPLIEENPINKPDQWQKTIPVVGFIGQFSEQKNLKLLVNSWLKFLKNGLKSYLLLVGDGEERGVIEELLCKEAPQNSWYITGWQEYPEHYLPLIDVYLMTSNFEGLPLALIESTSYGIPAIVTNFNGATDIAQKASWVKIVNQNEADLISQALQDSLRNGSLLKQQAQKGKNEFQQYFSVKRMAEDTMLALGLN